MWLLEWLLKLLISIFGRGAYVPRTVMGEEEEEKRIFRKQLAMFVEMVSDLFKQFNIHAIHEFCSGPGALITLVQQQLQAAGHALEVTCVDRDQATLEAAQEYNPLLKIQQGDITTEIFSRGSLGHVLLCFGLQYIGLKKRLATFTALWHQMSEGSLLIVGEQIRNMELLAPISWRKYPLLKIGYALILCYMRATGWDPNVALTIHHELMRTGKWRRVSREMKLYHGPLKGMPPGQIENFWFKVEMGEKILAKFSKWLAAEFRRQAREWAEKDPNAGFATIVDLSAYERI